MNDQAQSPQSARPAFEDFNPQQPVTSYGRIALQVMSNPKIFFASMAQKGGFQPPALFAVISFVVPAVGIALINQQPSAMGLNLALAAGWVFFAFVLHFIVTRAVPGQGDFEATFRILAYSSFTNLTGIIPFMAMSIAAFFYGLYLTVQGLMAVHRLTLGQTIKAIALFLAAQLIISLFVVKLLIAL